jgi:hypothetical protein
MFPTPKGYISIPAAVDRVLRTLHGEPEEIPWHGDELDQAALHRGRERATKAQDWLVTELLAGRLVAQVSNIEVPSEYWTCYGAHTTASTGLLQPPEISASDYAEIAYKPCFIERSAFEDRLSMIDNPSVVPLKSKVEAQGAYDEHVEATQQNKGRSSSWREDEVWRKLNGVTRDRLRELRNESNFRSPEDRLPGLRKIGGKLAKGLSQITRTNSL